eukprot:CAMPEP_0203809722 /NCGR_PEP_ID=MMETSP0115-20131106/2480_1 /ASSEMBLY_ACC=CAM_ASM_000227 /TAXON_ID=33651 /ORGANISM="Bicosoecid sp, Strain ms1" /LENGTH=208 /DNA_ID=CAMNT_0050718477 /DNA_START=70 /DNA_END=696 /DNA_ORIENTATION=+
MEKAKASFKEIDANTRDIRLLNVMAEKTGLSRVACLGITLGVVGLVAFFGVGAGFFCNVVGFIYPAYASFKAIESHDKDDDTQWLTYWVVYAAFCILEAFADFIMAWLPFYYVFKFAFLIWAQWPGLNGAGVVYNDFIRPFLIKHEKTVDGALSGAASGVKEAAAEAAAAAADAAKAGVQSAMQSDAVRGAVAGVLAGGAAGEGKKDS